VKIRVMVMMVPIMVMMVYDHHNLSLRGVGNRKTEKESETKPESLHGFIVTRGCTVC
jgi:hypothetical protein